MIIRQIILNSIQKNKKKEISFNYIINKTFIKNKKVKINVKNFIPKLETLIILKIYQKINNNKKCIELCCGAGILHNKNKKSDNVELILESICNIKTKNKNIYTNIKYLIENKKKYNIIINNPPYLCFKDFIFYYNIKRIKKTLYINFKGLNNLLTSIKKLINTTNINCSIIKEHGYNQGKFIRKILKHNGFINTVTIKDYAKIERITYCEF